MGFFDRWKRPRKRTMDKAATSTAAGTLGQFVDSREGVEGWAEQPTSFNPPSLLLVAADGEWVRQTVPDIAWAHQFCHQRKLPCHQAGLVSYPQRMRDYNARQRARGAS